jgi:hypothetical protein
LLRISGNPPISHAILRLLGDRVYARGIDESKRITDRLLDVDGLTRWYRSSTKPE